MKKQSKHTFQAWVESLQAKGRVSFSKAEAAEAYAGGAALSKAIDRLLKAKILAKPKAGFYLILDPVHRVQGSLPPEWFIDALMKHLGLPYYVGGLSAAALYGASHQAAQEYHVVVPGDRKGLRPIRCGRVRIRPLLKAAFKQAVTQQAKSQTGYFLAASPEMAAWDMVYFIPSLGGLDQAATVLRDLSERLDAGKLAQLAKAQEDELVSRRLGWLLEKIGSPKLAVALKPKEPAKLAWRQVAPGPYAGRKFGRNQAWRLVENHSLDLDQ